MMTVLHVIFGTVALVAAPAALFVRKGGTWHGRVGFAFIGAMAVVLFSAGFLWQAKGHLFLLPLAAVSAYLIFSGYRSVARKRRRVPDTFEDRIDIGAAGVAVLAGVAAAYLGGAASTPLMMSIKPALIGIGAIAIAFAMNDVLGFTGPRMRLGWLLSHFAGMIAAYISAVTAFVVINAHDVPMILRWAVPSALGATTIAGFTLRYLVPAYRRAWRTPAAAPAESSWRSVAPATPPAASVRLR
jgi:uncharacterized membrane protein